MTPRRVPTILAHVDTLSEPIPSEKSGPHAVVLTVLAGLFLARVAGQALVAFGVGGPFPGMPHWYSGLLPYPLLLPTQLAILILQAVICVQVARGRGRFAAPRRRRLGRTLIAVAAVYAASMVVRYAVTMAWYPERRWLGPGTIPSVFHVVLAAFIATLGHHHTRGPGSVH